MRTTILSVATALLLVACGTPRLSVAEKAARLAAQMQQVDSLVRGMRFGIEVNAAFPQRGNMVNLNYDYGIQVHGDTLRSYLPYYGRAYQIPYGGGKALDFSEHIQRYALTQGKKGERQLQMWVENDEDAYVYTLKVYAGGNIDLTVESHQRDRIRFTGRLTAEADR